MSAVPQDAIPSRPTNMVQHDMFSVPAVYEQGRTVGRPLRPLRPWQTAALAAVLGQFETKRSTLVVACTGSGKSRLGVQVAKAIKGRTLWLAPRYELLTQARDAIQAETDLTVGMEQADNHADSEDIVVASVATLHKAARLGRYSPSDFALVVCDEAHFSVSRTYRKIVDYFSGAKVIGLTATPDRLDKVGLYNLFQSVAYIYDIQDAIRDGVLCRVRAEHVNVEAIDLKDVGTSGDDFQIDQLDAVLRSREALHGVVKPVLEKAGNRPTFVFTTSVDTANALVEVFNAYRPDCARAAFGDTGFDVRADYLNAHRAGEFQFFVSVGIHTYGVDAPWVSCIVLDRPSKSRTYVAQAIGRGTRTANGKTDLLVLDFCGNTGRHKLVTPLDILGGRFPPEIVAKAKERAEPGCDVLELLDNEERAEEERIKAELIAKADAERARVAQFRANVRHTSTVADLFGHFKLDTTSLLLAANQSVQPGQVDRLRKYGIPIPSDLTRAAATAILKKEGGRRFHGWATYKQVVLLAKYGIDASSMKNQQAKNAIDDLAQNGWRRKGAA